MKYTKIFFYIFTVLSIFFWFTNSIFYKFSHFPANNFEFEEFYEKNYNILKYSWNTNGSSNKKINLSDIQDVINSFPYIWYMQYTYYQRYWFENTKDNNLDLTNLHRTKLNYPIFSIAYEKNYISFISINNLNDQQINTIWEKYQFESWSIISKYLDDWFIIRQNSPKDVSYVYEYEKYFDILQKFIEKNLVNYQIWQNPFWYHEINDFSDNIIQIWTLKNNKLNWIILDLKKNMPWILVSVEKYWQNYLRDEIMMQNIQNLYFNVKKYKETMWWLPQDLWSLNPNFLDITSFNDYYHKLKFTKESNLCYSAWFIPKSNDFKRLFSFEIKWEYWMSYVCY